MVYVQTRLRWSPSLQWRAVLEVPRLQKTSGMRMWERNCHASGNEKDPYAVASSDVKEHHRRPCTQEDISCLLAISGRSAACLLAIGRSETEAL